MNPTVEDVLRRAADFEKEAHELLSGFETAPSRIISLAETRKQIGILNLKQTELFGEAVRAIEFQLYRSAIVMAWSGFMDFLQEKMTSDGLVRLHQVRPGWAKIGSLHELREAYTEHAMLDAARDLKLLRKAELKSLQGLLSKRNESAHPSGYRPGLNEALGYMSELLNRIPTINQRPL